MCGIVGFWDQSGAACNLDEIASAMASSIAHRGPDDAGVWWDAAAQVAFGHRRLSILDLSVAGHQPMASPGGRWVIAFNGEIYNHLDIRRELERCGYRPQWRGHSDTETLLAGFDCWGVIETIERCVGMFSIALWDSHAKEIWLLRDRMGEKPLYYGWQSDVFMFASELSAFDAHPAFQGTISPSAVALLTKFNCIPAPYSIFEGIRKLEPGCFVRIFPDGRPTEHGEYWSLFGVATAGEEAGRIKSDDEWLSSFENSFMRAVSCQMVADVPLGALLSGGIDSSAVVAMMALIGSGETRTFTIGFDERPWDESVHAAAVAKHLRTCHTEVRLTSKDAMDLIPSMADVYDEPFADSSQLPTLLVMKLAKQSVSVALSGDGGDEVFGGYNRYVLAPRIWERMSRIPAWGRRLLGQSAGAIPLSLLELLDPIARHFIGQAHFGQKVRRVGKRLSEVSSVEDLHLELVSEWRGRNPVLATDSNKPLVGDVSRWPTLSSTCARMMAVDGRTYLPDDILTKVDRAAMAVSLETRAPFLDHSLVELAWQMPMHMKIRNGKGKWVVRKWLEKRIPTDLLDRPKQGFGIPLDDWLRGPLRGWAEELLSESVLIEGGIFDPSVVRSEWHAHLRGEVSAGYRLWSVLMFQAWQVKRERRLR